MPEFQAWPKIHRLYRDVIITEKLDGTNAAVGVTDDGEVYAQSRKKLIYPGKQDNAGFAGFVAEQADEFRELLGPGLHFGEWVGPGIQSNRYGLSEKRFALFNVVRWISTERPKRVDVVPALYQGVFSEHALHAVLHELRKNGSMYAREHTPFNSPLTIRDAEGAVLFHARANVAFKVTLENDEMSKGEALAYAQA